MTGQAGEVLFREEDRAPAEQDGSGPDDKTGSGLSRASLDIAPLVNAVARLEEGLERHRREPADEQLRDGLILRFGFTYERAHRLLQRYLREVSASPGSFDQMSFADLIRTGDELGLLAGDWPAWRRYRDMRARTSHTYAASVAAQAVAGIPDFLAEAIYLRDQLQGRLP